MPSSKTLELELYLQCKHSNPGQAWHSQKVKEKVSVIFTATANIPIVKVQLPSGILLPSLQVLT